MSKRIIILGATGSIGRSTVDVALSRPGAFEIVGLSANTDADGLLALGARFPGAVLALDGRADERFAFSGAGASAKLVSEIAADIAVNGIAGAAGLLPSLAALDSGVDLALANKETVVMAWPRVAERAARGGALVLPVDSEHSAVFHLMNAHGRDAVDEIVLTASGGPFRGWSKEKLKSVRVEDALAHPTWNMGGKITVDSASLANKGLEVIEAVRLFGVVPEKVKVVVHPQSRVHSLVRLRDGSLYAQVSMPDMRVPIHNALAWPDCVETPFGRLDLAGETLTFEKPDMEAFPLLGLAYGAAARGGLYPAAYNAADEVAVEAFRFRGLGFSRIASIVEETLSDNWAGGDESIDSILDGDARARARAESAVTRALEGK